MTEEPTCRCAGSRLLLDSLCRRLTPRFVFFFFFWPLSFGLESHGRKKSRPKDRKPAWGVGVGCWMKLIFLASLVFISLRHTVLPSPPPLVPATMEEFCISLIAMATASGPTFYLPHVLTADPLSLVLLLTVNAQTPFFVNLFFSFFACVPCSGSRCAQLKMPLSESRWSRRYIIHSPCGFFLEITVNVQLLV